MRDQTPGLWEQILDSKTKKLNTSYGEDFQKDSPPTFIDLFTGAEEFHLAMHNVGVQHVFVGEWDQYARQTYEANYRKLTPELFSRGLFAGDITKVDPASIPPFDTLCTGFPH